MADISTDELKNEIHAILKTADLSVISAKKVREQVEKKLNCSLLSRKKEFDKIVMDFINSQQDDEDEGSQNERNEDGTASDDESEEEESSEEEKKTTTTKKRPQAANRSSAAKIPAKKKRKSLNASDSGTESDGGSDSDYEVPKKKATSKKKKSGGSGATKGEGSGGGRKSTGFTRSYNLSPELSALMGADALPRHEVVKKVWAIIKERNLYDPKNKQFAICDDELMKVMKVKRFRTFGMLKHLKPHFLE